MTDLNSAKQQADDDLTWLARNVHRWFDGDYLIRVGKIGYTFREHCEGETVLPNWYTRDQWLTRRAELQSKPRWKDAPGWAEWLAQTQAGFWSWGRGVAAEAKSIAGHGIWVASDRGHGVWVASDRGYEWSGMAGEVLGNWRDTLERRPQEAKSEPNPEPSSDDWYKRGELPPVGLPVQLWFDGSYAYDCEFIAERGNNLILWNLTWDRSDNADKSMCQFRPIQTERERIASELVDVMMAVPVSDRKTASESYMSMALAIYDHLHQESKS